MLWLAPCVPGTSKVTMISQVSANPSGNSLVKKPDKSGPSQIDAGRDSQRPCVAYWGCLDLMNLMQLARPWVLHRKIKGALRIVVPTCKETPLIRGAKLHNVVQDFLVSQQRSSKPKLALFCMRIRWCNFDINAPWCWELSNHKSTWHFLKC